MKATIIDLIHREHDIGDINTLSELKSCVNSLIKIYGAGAKISYKLQYGYDPDSDVVPDPDVVFIVQKEKKSNK